MEGNTLADQLVTFTRCFDEALPVANDDLSSTTLNQARVFQLPGNIRDTWPMDAQHFGHQVLTDRQCVIVASVSHHQQPSRQPLFEAMRTVACNRNEDLLEKCLDVSVREISERWDSSHSPRERRPGHLCRAPGDLDQEPGRRHFGAQDGLHARATLPANRCHLDGAAVRIDRQDRDDAAIGEEDMIERTIGVHQDLLGVAWNAFKLRQKPFEIAGRQSKQKTVPRPAW